MHENAPRTHAEGLIIRVISLSLRLGVDEVAREQLPPSMRRLLRQLEERSEAGR
jgi:hypothetical protein